MKVLRDGPWLGGSLIVAAALFAAVSYWQLLAAQTEAQISSRLLSESHGYAQQIEQGRSSPAVVSDQAMELTLLAHLIERAADEAGVNRQALDRIWPQPPRRVGDSPYLRKATQLVVRDVTMAQGIGFLHRLTTGDSPMNLDALRLSAPRASTSAAGGSLSASRRRSQEPETWTLEATVSQLIYHPTTTDSPTPGFAQRN